jgi:hypothetical protein
MAPALYEGTAPWPTPAFLEARRAIAQPVPQPGEQPWQAGGLVRPTPCTPLYPALNMAVLALSTRYSLCILIMLTILTIRFQPGASSLYLLGYYTYYTLSTRCFLYTYYAYYTYYPLSTRFPRSPRVERSTARRAWRRSWFEMTPIKHGQFPIKHGHFPTKRCHFPIRHGHFPIKHEHFPINHVHILIDHGRLHRRTRCNWLKVAPTPCAQERAPWPHLSCLEACGSSTPPNAHPRQPRRHGGAAQAPPGQPEKEGSPLETTRPLLLAPTGCWRPRRARPQLAARPQLVESGAKLLNTNFTNLLLYSTLLYSTTTLLHYYTTTLTRRPSASWLKVAPNLDGGTSPWPTTANLEAGRAPAQPGAQPGQAERRVRRRQARTNRPST